MAAGCGPARWVSPVASLRQLARVQKTAGICLKEPLAGFDQVLPRVLRNCARCVRANNRVRTQGSNPPQLTSDTAEKTTLAVFQHKPRQCGKPTCPSQLH